MLVCASEFFKACLRDNNLEQYYHFSDVSVQGIEGILHFLYGDCGKVDSKDYRDVYEAACIFAVPLAKTFFKGLLKESAKNQSTEQQRKDESNRDETNPNEEVDESKNCEFQETKEARDEVPSEKANTLHVPQESSEASQKAADCQEAAGADLIQLQQQSMLKYDLRPCSVLLSNVEVEQKLQNKNRVLIRNLPTCNVCGKKFLRLGFLRRHKEKKHSRYRDRRLYKCDFCPKVCRTPKDLKLHRRRHTGTFNSRMNLHVSEFIGGGGMRVSSVSHSFW